jgi:large subunit ribosomal protein L14
MIQPQSYLVVADNSGARELMCIRILGSSNGKYGYIGNTIIAVVKDTLPDMTVKKSEIVRAVIVRTSKGIRRRNGMMVCFDDNAAVIVNKDGNPKGTRIFGPVVQELRSFRFTKILSLAPEVL